MLLTVVGVYLTTFNWVGDAINHSTLLGSLSFRPTLAPLAIPRLNIEIKIYLAADGTQTHNLVVCCLLSVVGLSQTAKIGQLPSEGSLHCSV